MAPERRRPFANAIRPEWNEILNNGGATGLKVADLAPVNGICGKCSKRGLNKEILDLRGKSVKNTK